MTRWRFRTYSNLGAVYQSVFSYNTPEDASYVGVGTLTSCDDSIIVYKVEEDAHAEDELLRSQATMSSQRYASAEAGRGVSH